MINYRIMLKGHTVLPKFRKPKERSLGSAFASPMINGSAGLASRKQYVGRKHTLQHIVGHPEVCDPLDVRTLFANRANEFGPIFFYVSNVFNIWTAAKDVVRA
jgi:hypothetical protein